MTAQRNSNHIDDLDVPPAPAFTDEESAVLLDEAITSLVLLRFPGSLGDAAAELHALATLIAQAEARLPQAISRAFDQDYDWHDISYSVNTTTAFTRHPYRSGEEHPPLDH